MNNPNIAQCQGCGYWNKYEQFCNYMDMTGKQRPRKGKKCLVTDRTAGKSRVRPGIKPLLAELGEMRVSK